MRMRTQAGQRGLLSPRVLRSRMCVPNTRQWRRWKRSCSRARVIATGHGRSSLFDPYPAARTTPVAIQCDVVREAPSTAVWTPPVKARRLRRPPWRAWCHQALVRHQVQVKARQREQWPPQHKRGQHNRGRPRRPGARRAARRRHAGSRRCAPCCRLVGRGPSMANAITLLTWHTATLNGSHF